ncbi:MAG: hypothetical protein VX339_03670, partial [Pseudomonadota bacterium]|nr:hypothetical protein [Pseudomonadota bacterium]
MSAMCAPPGVLWLVLVIKLSIDQGTEAVETTLVQSPRHCQRHDPEGEDWNCYHRRQPLFGTTRSQASWGDALARYAHQGIDHRRR